MLCNVRNESHALVSYPAAPRGYIRASDNRVKRQCPTLQTPRNAGLRAAAAAAIAVRACSPGTVFGSPPPVLNGSASNGTAGRSPSHASATGSRPRSGSSGSGTPTHKGDPAMGLQVGGGGRA